MTDYVYRFVGRPGDHTPGVFYGPEGAVPMHDLTAEEATQYGVLDTAGALDLMYEKFVSPTDEVEGVEDNEEEAE